MTLDKYSLWEDLVRKVAKFIARDFPETEEEDLFQDLMTFVLGNDKLISPDEDYASKGLYDKGHEFAWNYRKQALYMSPQYAYRTSDVKRILETIFDYEDWDSSVIPEDAKTFRADDRLAVNSDLMSAYKRISATYQKAIYSRYGKRIFPQTPADKMRLSRAIERLTDILNTYKPRDKREGVGSRKVISNTIATHIIRDQT